ncbi:hypothetical protein A3L11_02980 [Thermococcus siculi]|uniref:KaiC-like domain-containing protein n=1 Tax=Thermococcus siculi TaxID=72803 RepID=A0A2Z2MMX8_9EURY|nr:hypothetical protein A3L11_02980 [Thermococcus siculi]
MNMRDTIMQKLWESMKMGEIVLVERTDGGDQYFGFYQLISWAKENGCNIVVVDILDSLHILMAKGKLAGLDVDALGELNVLKLGGTIETGNVIGWIKDISEPVIMAKKFGETYEKLLESMSPLLTVTVGIEKLFIASEISPQNIRVIISAMARYVGNEKRISMLFLKTDVVGTLQPPVIALLEDIATTVIQVSRKNRTTEFHVTKSVNKEIEGLMIKI